jgi:hypothetical protein
MVCGRSEMDSKYGGYEGSQAFKCQVKLKINLI